MLVPDTIQAAATAANAEVVLAWLDAGNDVNSNGGSYSYNLLTATAMATPIAEANVALARELLRRGADPRLGNNHSYGQWVPLHAAARGQGPADRELAQPAPAARAGYRASQQCRSWGCFGRIGSVFRMWNVFQGL